MESPPFENTHVSNAMSSVIMVSLSFGVCVFAFPYVVLILGPITFIISIICVVGLLCFYALIQNESTQRVMTMIGKEHMFHNPYMTISDLTLGTMYTSFVKAIFYLYLLVVTIAFQISAATVLTDFIDFGLSYYVELRIWVSIVILISTPFMMKEAYSDMAVPAVITLSTAFIAMICIMVLSLIAKYQYGVIPKETFINAEKTSLFSFFVLFGVVIFETTAIPSIVPNIILLLKSTKDFTKSIYISHIILTTGYLISGLVPYFVFGAAVKSNITVTLHEFLLKTDNSWFFRAMLVIIQLCLAAHFTMVSVLQINPLYLSLEKHMNIQRGFSWKRFLLRSSLLLGMLVVCVAIPYFTPLLSLIGSGPAFIFLFLFQTIFYWKLIAVSKTMKFLLVAFFVVLTVFCMGSTVCSIESIIATFPKDTVWSGK